MPDNSLNNKRIAKNTLFLYLRMFFVLAVSLYTTRVVLNVLGVEDYGLNNVVCGFVSMFTFLSTSMSNGIQRFYNYEIGENNGKNMDQVYTIALLTQLTILLIVLILTESFGIWYLNNKMVIADDRIWVANWIFQFSIISFSFVIMQVPFSAAIMAYEKMDYFAIVSIVNSILHLLFVILLNFINHSDKLLLYGVLSLTTQIITFLLYFVYSKSKIPKLKINRQYDKTLFKSMLFFSGWNLFGSFAYTMKGQGLNVLLNAFGGTIVNAARGISSQILSALNGFSSNIFIAFRPQIVQSYALRDYKRTTELMFAMSNITFFLFYMLSIPIILEIDYILHIWIGNNVPEYTSIFTKLIIINMIISNFNTAISQVIHATGKMKFYQIVTSFFILLILPVSWIFLKLDYSPISVYWVSLLIVCFNQIVCVYMLKRVFPFSLKEYACKVVLRCLFIGGVSLILPLFIHTILKESLIRLVIVSLSSCFCTLIISYYCGLDNNQRIMVQKIINKRFNIRKND